MNKFNLGPFLGAHTSIDPRHISAHNAADQQNVLLEDGRLTYRYGYSAVAAQTNFTSPHGLEFMQGYDSSYNYQKEFVSFERLSTHTAGKCRPYSRHVTTGAATEITGPAAATIELTNTGNWQGFSFNGYGYFCNPNETNSVQRYTVGDLDSWAPLGIPATPATAISWKVIYGGANNAYSQLSYAGLTATSATHVACTGIADTSGGGANSGATVDATTGQLDLLLKKPTGTAGQEFEVTIDLNYATASIQDWSNNDIFGLSFATERPDFEVRLRYIEFINNDGSPLTFTQDELDYRASNATGGFHSAYRVEFMNKVRASWDNIRKIKFYLRADGNISSTTTNNRFTIWKVYVGGVNILGGSDYSRTQGQSVRVGYSYYWSAAGLESGIGGVARMTPNIFKGYTPGGLLDLPPLGTHIQFTATVSGDANVDYYRFYWEDDKGHWRRLVTQTDATATFTHKITYPEVIALTEYVPTEFKLGNVKNGFPFKGWVVWLYQGGYQNVRHSRIGVPESLYNEDTSEPDDDNQGATFSLADNNADEPLCGCQADDAALIVGNDGVYAQVGNRPREMTPPKKLPGSFGAANSYCAARWSIGGQPGIAVLSRSGEGVYFYAVNSGFDGQTGYTVTELTQPVRKSLKAFLLDPQSLTNFSTAKLYVEEQTDALWLIVGKRAMVLRRPSLTDGNRNWEFYNYTLSNVVSYVAVSPQYRMRWIESGGKFDEIEYDNTNSAYFNGSLRDGGSAPPSAFWTSKTFSGARRRALWANIHKENTTDTPTISSIATNATSAQTCASGARVVKFGTAQYGWEHQYKVALVEGQGYVADVEISETVPIGERRRTS